MDVTSRKADDVDEGVSFHQVDAHPRGVTSMQQRLGVRSRPSAQPAMYQSWRELLFLHWRFDPALVQATLPPGLTVDTFDGHAWVGLVPFFMRDIRPCWSPAVPGISNFQELNCRTYAVDEHGIPGVWFYSLDTDSRLAVWWAKTFYHLPYHYARISYTWNRETGRVEFESHRRGTPDRLANRFVYQPIGVPATCEPGTLEFFLIERYVLFAQGRNGRLSRGVVHHPPYEVSPAQVEACDDSLIAMNELPRRLVPPDHALISRGVDVEVFALHT